MRGCQARQLGRRGLLLLRCLCQATDEVASSTRALTSLSHLSDGLVEARRCLSLSADRMPLHRSFQRYFSSLPPHTEMMMPALSPTMTQGNIVKWLVKVGQEVAPGDVLAEVETDKATLSWENQDEGFIAKLLVPEGAQGVPVGTPVAVLVEEVEAVPAFKSYSVAGEATTPEAPAAESSPPAQAAAAGGKDEAYYSSLPPYAEMTMPALSPTMTQGNIVKWLVKVGQEVAPGDLLAEVETDKATLSWENQDEGFIAKLLVPEGAQGVPVGAPVAVLVDEAEAVPKLADYTPRGAVAAAGPVTVAKSAPAEAPQEAEEDEHEEVWDRIGPAARLLLESSKLSRSAVRATGPHGIVTKGDVLEAIRQAELAPKAESAAAKQAGQPATPQPVAAAVRQPATPPKAATAAAVVAPPVELGPRRARRGGAPAYVDIPNSQIRKIIAQRLVESKRTIPHLYLSADVDLEGVGALREALKQQGTKVSLNDCIIKAVALALAEVPAANTYWDTAQDQAVGFASIDVAVAVATPAGLITPIVKAANTKSVVQISAEVRDLAVRARANKLAPEEFQGGSFTISNLGMYGVEKFFAIINPPQACIMSVGSGQIVPVLNGTQQTTQTLMTVTLSADERVYDGEVSSKFLDAFKRHISAPYNMML